jgi:hypothetical protein
MVRRNALGGTRASFLLARLDVQITQPILIKSSTSGSNTFFHCGKLLLVRESEFGYRQR